MIDAAFEPVGDGQAAAADLADNSGGLALPSPGRVGTRFLIPGETGEDVEESAYAFATSLARELERIGAVKIRVGIGDIVDKPEEIYQSFRTARHIRHLLVERSDENAIILGTREMGEAADEKTPAVISEAKLYMAQNFTNPSLMLQDVAKAVGMSNSRFSTVFSQQNGQTFTEYLIYLRLGKAKELLRNTTVKGSQIAREVGYNDAHYFSYIFKKNTGLTPSDYRAQYQNQPE